MIVFGTSCLGNLYRALPMETKVALNMSRSERVVVNAAYGRHKCRMHFGGKREASYEKRTRWRRYLTGLMWSYDA